eukprot:TRINITY_DN48106_c0_g1_i1.p1 TRINITY_DN48106_c0_g1~~TRINITY_DN48106_c0_g1_i1.p1  ORF type:complete len:930 (+),score=163.37 TRINITY_DN48106_c0_g1_i1:108-2897(+)
MRLGALLVSTSVLLTLPQRTLVSVSASAVESKEEQSRRLRLSNINSGKVKFANRCVSFQIDVYQRFSDYVVKYRVSQICEQVLYLVDSLLRLNEDRTPDEGQSALDVKEQFTLQVVQAFLSLADSHDALLTDTGVAGDGSFLKAIREHLESFADSLSRAVGPAAKASKAVIDWADAGASLSEALLQLMEHVFQQIEDGVTFNIRNLNVSDVPRFLTLLDSFPATVTVDVRGASSTACADVPRIYASQHVYDPIADPSAWKRKDVSGLYAQSPPVEKLLFTIAKAMPLAYNFVSVAPRAQVGEQELTHEYQKMYEGGKSAAASGKLAAEGGAAPLSCEGVGLSYSPAQCLFDLGWGSTQFSLGTEPPFDGVLAVSEMSRRGTERPQPFVQPVANGTSSLEELLDHVDGVYKSLNTPSPDLLFLSPMVGNCLTLRKLGPSRREGGITGPPHLMPKIVLVPVNPLIPPPWQVAPNFTKWHHDWLLQDRAFNEADWWLAQCSLSSTEAVMKEQGYTLLHMEHSFAVFIAGSLLKTVQGLLKEPPKEDAGVALAYDQWLRGWHCSPVSWTLFGLENAAAASGLAELRDRHASHQTQLEKLCAFVQAHRLPLASDLSPSCGGTSKKAPVRMAQSWRTSELKDVAEERGKAYLLESSGRGRCLQGLGVCECFPPYRGRFCEDTEPGKLDDKRQWKGVLHYLVGDRERLLNDFTRTLPILWEKFNERFDYPVVVFHDGMSAASRQRILEASPNRIWFAYVEDYTAVPSFLSDRPELNLGGYGLGYRGMCRFRSGPMFTHPVMKRFDYAWTLDTDGYFPASIESDPFENMWKGDYAYGFSHISRDQASAVQHFWEFCRLYIESKGLNPKGTKMMRRITDALVLRDTYWHEWNRVLFMNDIEITKLSWFRDDRFLCRTEQQYPRRSRMGRGLLWSTFFV